VTRRWIAADGYRARPAGPWTRDKLRYMERYASAFMTAMAPKRRQGKWNQLVYIDLLAGPGKGIDRTTRAEFDGSPLRALRVRPKFDRVYLGDARPRNVAILRRRIATEDLQRVDIEVDDCNVRAGKIVESLPSKTLGLAFIDPEGFEATFSIFRTLARRPIDILLLFPSGIGIRRNLRASSSSRAARWTLFGVDLNGAIFLWPSRRPDGAFLRQKQTHWIDRGFSVSEKR
jgi:three-Cys-motif partner protein